MDGQQVGGDSAEEETEVFIRVLGRAVGGAVGGAVGVTCADQQVVDRLGLL